MRPRTAVASQVLLGVGFGAFVDGIVLHQILQWHHMLSATSGHPTTTVAGLETNTLADGLFHAAALIATVLGVVGVVRAWQDGLLAPPWRRHAGLLLIGWGMFNLIEGVVDHHLLGVHNVRDDVSDPALWNAGFLVASAMLVVAGVLLSGERRGDPARLPTDRNAARDVGRVEVS